MIDTVAATIMLDERLDIGLFDGGEVVQATGLTKPRRDRFWINGSSQLSGPRVTYYVYDRVGDAGMLRVEFEVPRMSMSSDMLDANPGVDEIARALDFVDRYLREVLSEALPSVRMWRAQRIDFAWNWRTDQAADYVLAFQRMAYRGVYRRDYADGVMWPSKTRTLKSYRRGDSVLRFEVSNYRDGCRALAAWLSCERTIGELCRPVVGLLSLGYAFDGLGMMPGEPLSGGADLVAARLRDAFGARNVATARHVMWCIAQHGTRSYKLGLVGRSTYYAWRSRLRDAGFTLSARDAIRLAPLPLPLGWVLSGSKHALLPQDVSDWDLAGLNPSSKNWPGFVETMRLASDVPRCLWIDKALSGAAPGASFLNGKSTGDAPDTL